VKTIVRFFHTLHEIYTTLNKDMNFKNSKILYQITIKGWIYCHTMSYDAITCFNDLFFMFLKPNKIYNFIIFMHEQKKFIIIHISSLCMSMYKLLNSLHVHLLQHFEVLIKQSIYFFKKSLKM